MFFAGCGADQNPLPRRTVALAQQYGRELADAVERALIDPMKTLAPMLKTGYAEIELALAAPPTRDDLVKLAEQGSGYAQRAASDSSRKLDQGKPLRTTYPYPIQIWRLGDQNIVAMGGEVVVDYAVTLKGLFGRDLSSWILNDLLAMFLGPRPSRRRLRRRHSQMEYDLPSKWQTTLNPAS